MLLTELDAARANTDALFDIVKPEARYDRPIAERHRLIFYLGHLEAFDWNLIARGPLDLPSFAPGLDRLFAFGIDPDSDSLPQDTPSDWPREEEVVAYNRRVRETLDRHLSAVPEQLVHVAIEHRLMHAETLAYILHNLPLEAKATRKSPEPANGTIVEERMLEIPAGTATMGRPSGDGFGWDNEFEAHKVHMSSFSMGKHKVTNGEYLRFVEAGGPAPHFWSGGNRDWRYRGMFGEVPLPLDRPAYVTQEQAAAYASWRGMRLPTEAEFQRSAYPAAADPARDNFDFRTWDPAPVTSGRPNRFGLVQMVGNGWEWTSTTFQPFPGFQPFPFYPGYSKPFFDGQHYVLKGASPRTAARLTRASFRNWFRPAYPYVYAAFRLAKS
jgi:formylglycine-generating enzyme required for sulfatase activity